LKRSLRTGQETHWLFPVGAGNRGTVRKEVLPEIGVRLRYMV